MPLEFAFSKWFIENALHPKVYVARNWKKRWFAHSLSMIARFLKRQFQILLPFLQHVSGT